MTPPFEPVYRTFSRVVYGAQLIVWVLAIVFGVSYCVSAKHSAQREAVAESTIARLTRDKRVLAMERAVASVQYVTDVQRVGVSRASYDSLARAFRRALNPPASHRFPLDTVPVPRDSVRQIVASADTAILACHRALNDCGDLLRIDSLTIANRDSLLTATRQLIPTRMDRVRGAAKWAVIGAAVAALYLGVKR